MRRTLSWAVLLVLLLAGCQFGRSLPVRQAEQRPGPTAEATLEGTGIRFQLNGYSGTELPALTVTAADSTDWSDRVDSPQWEGDVVSAKLQGEKGTARLAVENMTYTWTLPNGQTVGGSIQFRDYRFREMKWELSRSDKLLVYHVNGLKQKEIDAWEELLANASSWMAQEREQPLVIWVFPGVRSLNDWGRYGEEFRVAGLWLGDIERLVVYDEANSTERLVVMLHEMVHALTPGEPPTWFDEGIARLFEARQEKLLDGERARRWQFAGYQLKQLQEVARGRAIDTSEATSRKESPLDPYTVGSSVWLFVKHHHGEEGVQRLIREGGAPNGVKLTLEDMFGKPLPAVWEDWNAYLRSEHLLKDWQNP